MRLNVRMVECFRTVMTVGTVTAAAELLNTSQPAISRSIQALEAALGLKLFDRVKSRLVPTAHAVALFEEVQKTFKGLDHLARVAHNLKSFQSGNISIVCAPAFSHGFIAEVASRFVAKHQDVSLTIETQMSWTIAEWLNAQRFDLGLAAYPLSLAGAVSTTFAEPDEVCVLPAGHPLGRSERIELPDFASASFVFLGGSDPYRYRLDALFSAANIPRRMVIETPNSATACEMVLRGAGLAIVNPFSALSFVDRGLVMRPLAASLPFTTTLLRARHRPTSPLVDLFVEELNCVRDDQLLAAQAACRR